MATLQLVTSVTHKGGLRQKAIHILGPDVLQSKRKRREIGNSKKKRKVTEKSKESERKSAK